MSEPRLTDASQSRSDERLAYEAPRIEEEEIMATLRVVTCTATSKTVPPCTTVTGGS